jgi:RNA polymerase sigma-70 factor, ECF subfamily
MMKADIDPRQGSDKPEVRNKTVPGPEIDLHAYDSEEELLDGLRRHDQDSCTCLVKRFASLVYAQALRLLTDPDEAEGVLQQTFLKACEKIDTFDGRSSLGTWLYRIATNEALMKLRRQQVRTTPLDYLNETIQAQDIPQNRNVWMVDPSQVVLDGELREYLETALAALPENLRVVFVLREMQGMSTSETAAVLDLKENAVKVRLHRARLRLRELLDGYLRVRESE